MPSERLGRESARANRTAGGDAAISSLEAAQYGTLSGEEKSDGRNSSLVVTTDTPEKAKLVLAKYLSDLSELPGVSPLSLTTARGPVSAHSIEKQGDLVALRHGNQVVVLTAPDPALLSRAVEANIPEGTRVDSSTAEMEVPMYLDRWDKYGFRFYYGPLTKPRDAQGRDLPGNYDPRQDFEFADKSGKSGLVVWNSPFSAPAADGIFDLTSREWAHQAAQARQLPLGHQHRHHRRQHRADQPLSRRRRPARRRLPRRLVL